MSHSVVRKQSFAPCPLEAAQADAMDAHNRNPYDLEIKGHQASIREDLPSRSSKLIDSHIDEDHTTRKTFIGVTLLGAHRFSAGSLQNMPHHHYGMPVAWRYEPQRHYLVGPSTNPEEQINGGVDFFAKPPTRVKWWRCTSDMPPAGACHMVACALDTIPQLILHVMSRPSATCCGCAKYCLGARWAYLVSGA
jgi:hypothetical protein